MSGNFLYLITSIRNNRNKGFVCDFRRKFNNSDFEKIVQQILEKIEAKRHIINYGYYNMKIDEAVKDYKVWLEEKRKRRNILKIVLTVASIGLAALIAKSASDNK